MSDPKPHDKTKKSSQEILQRLPAQIRQGERIQRDANLRASKSGRSNQPPLPSSLLPSFFLSSAVAAAAGAGASGRPFSILASILGRSSGSGFRSRAWAHWNLASSVRPTRQ